MAEDFRFPTFVDERGSLLPVEFDAVPFEVRRVFVVHGGEAGLQRGQHEVSCLELVVLLSGQATFVVSATPADRTRVLAEPGQSLLLETGQFVAYALDGPGSSILVLASRAYEPPSEES